MSNSVSTFDPTDQVLEGEPDLDNSEPDLDNSEPDLDNLDKPLASTPAQRSLLATNYAESDRYDWQNEHKFKYWCQKLNRTEASYLIKLSGGTTDEPYAPDWIMFEQMLTSLNCPKEFLTK